MSKDKNPCLSCGLCCISYPTNAKNNKHHQEWARILDSEVDNVPRTLYRITRNVKLDVHKEAGYNKFIKDKPDPIWKGFRRCVALEGTQCREIKCGVYENRPKVCSDFPVGGERCNAIRKWGGLEELNEKDL